jgi:peptidoglycan/LPS O-acetylase OafA/YrhL
VEALSTARKAPVFATAPTTPLLVLAEPRLASPSDKQASPFPYRSTRIPALDGLRGVAILLVILRHSVFGMETQSHLLANILVAGQLTWSGVDLFFVLSGFLIGGILLDARDSPCYFQTFYIRRAYRIFPLYGLVAGLFLVRHLPFHLIPGNLGEHSPLQIPWAAYLTLTQNWWMAALGWYGSMAMAPTWSLAVEEQFYLTIPFVIRKLRQSWLPVLLLAVIVGAPLLRTILHFHFIYGSFASYVLTPCRADALCLGVLTSLLVRKPAFWNGVLRHQGLLYFVTAALFVVMAFMTYRRYDQFYFPMITLGYSCIALFYTCCLLIVITASGGTVSRVLCSRTLMQLGTFAYCIYLTHEFFIQAGRRLLALRAPPFPGDNLASGRMAWSSRQPCGRVVVVEVLRETTAAPRSPAQLLRSDRWWPKSTTAGRIQPLARG